jgi:HAD superfamily hydrolase (TIGR01549 family)
MKKAIIFDYDDTLVTTVQTKWAQMKECASRFYGIDLKDDTIMSVWGQDIKVVIETCYQNREPYADMMDKYRSLEEDFRMKFHPGAAEVLEYFFKDSNYLVGILTASSNKLVNEQLKYLGVDLEQFFMLQTAEDTNVHKPDPAVFEPSLEKLASYSISNLNTVYVGDAIRDYKAATGAGIKFIGVTNGLTSSKEFQSLGADYVDNIADIIELLA